MFVSKFIQKLKYKFLDKVTNQPLRKIFRTEIKGHLNGAEITGHVNEAADVH